MKKLLIASLIACALTAAASAEQASSITAFSAEIATTLAEMSSTQVGTLTVGDIEGLAERLSIAAQKRHYVQRARAASFMMPGAGQFMTGDTTGGALFMLGNLAIVAGTLTIAYFLLPADLQFGSTNYFTDSFATIDSRWKSKSFMDYLPAIGTMAGGMILRGVLGKFSSMNAAELARRNIADGKVTFTPSFEFLGHGFGMGIGMRWRY
jgi:hypothetical protein